MTTEAVKPCPFDCGGDVGAPQAVNYGDGLFYRVFHTPGKFRCPAQGLHHLTDWNRRATPPAPPVSRDAVIEAPGAAKRDMVAERLRSAPAQEMAQCLRLVLPWLKGQDKSLFTDAAAANLAGRVCDALDAFDAHTISSDNGRQNSMAPGADWGLTGRECEDCSRPDCPNLCAVCAAKRLANVESQLARASEAPPAAPSEDTK